MKTLIGPISQIITLKNGATKGPLSDDQLGVIEDGGIIVNNGLIEKVGRYKDLKNGDINYLHLDEPMVVVPGLVDAHTHICFGGSRAGDYALRVGGSTYQEILKNGGGIHDTVQKTRAETESTLSDSLTARALRHLREGVTTCEVKSGYGLSVTAELSMLRAIKRANDLLPLDLIPTCLAAHVCPKEFALPKEYLEHIEEELFPILKSEGLANRIDIFTEDGAFDVDLSREYLSRAKARGFELTIHADQFSNGGSELAVELGAISADHLEASLEADITRLGKSDVVSTVLPGASLGLGMQYAPARKLLDAGACVAIATDWNPGSAPMGDLLIQTALLGAAEKLSIAECLAGITYRAAKALNLNDRGRIDREMIADFIAFPTHDYREIFYQQGKLKPTKVWKRGTLID